ncbi:MAG: hypothetical protein IKA40_04060, partial [Clostridia bacterium]|nr:hypothetical protein [Clostridia bacterium]
GADTVNTVTVEEGTALTAADIPADASKEGYFFDGWFVGNVKVEAGYVAEGETVTIEAAFTKGVKVTFKNGEASMATVLVRPGTALNENDYPDEPAAETNFAFDAWVDAEDNVVDITEATFTVDTEVFASFTRTAYTVTFGTTPVQVNKADGAFKLKAADIPAGAVETDKAFIGWFTAGGVKAVADMEIDADVVFAAQYIAKADYVGTWIDKTNKVILTVTDTEIAFTNNNGDDKQGEYTFDTVNGSLTAAKVNDSSYYYDNATLALVNGALTLTNNYYDASYEEDVSDTFTFEKTAPVAYAGNYRSGTTQLIITDGGVVTNYNGVKDYALMTDNGDGTYTIEYKTYSAYETVTATFDAKGNIVIADGSANAYNGLFIKNATDCDSYYDDDYDNYVYLYTMEDADQVVVYRDKDMNYAYATIDGEWAQGNEVVLTANDNEMVVKVVSSYKIAVAKAERGTYVKKFAENVDAFAGVWVAPETAAYKFTLTFDGVGNVNVYRATEYSVTDVDAEYTVSGNVATFYANWEDWTVTLNDDGTLKVFSIDMDYASSANDVYTKSEASIYLDGFGTATVNGATQGYYFVGDICVIGENGYTFDGETYTEVAGNGKAATFAQFDNSSRTLKLDNFGGAIITYYSTNYQGTYTYAEDGLTITLVDTYYCEGTYTIAENGKVFLNEEDGYIFIQDGYTVPSQESAFDGDNNGWWKNDEAEEYVYIDTANDQITIDGQTKTYEANWNGTLLEFSVYDSETWSTTYYEITMVEGKLQVLTRTYSTTLATRTYTSVAEPVVEPAEIDAFVGSYEGMNKFYFDGFGKGYFNTTSFTYTVNANGEAVFEADAFSFVVSVKEDGVLTVNWEDWDYYTGSYEVTAMTEGFVGVWVAPETETYYNYKLTFTGTGIVNVYKEGSYSTTDKNIAYTVDGNVVTFEMDYEPWVITLNADDTLTVQVTDMDSYTYINATYNKVVEEGDEGEEEGVLDAFAGAWTSTSNNYYEYTLTFDGKGNVTVSSTKYPDSSYYNGTSTYAVDGNVATFDVIGYSWTVTLNEDGTLKVYNIDEYGEGSSVNTNFTKVVEGGDEGEGEEEVVLDAFAGVWTLEDDSYNYYQFTITFDGKGNLTVSSAKYPDSSYYNGTGTYTVDGNTATANVLGEWTFTLNEDGSLKVYNVDEYGDVMVNTNYNKVVEGGDEEEPTLDAFAGSYTGTNNFTFDGAGNGTLNETTAFTYTVNANGEAEFEANGMSFVVSVKSEGVLTVAWDDYEYTGSYDITAV